MRIRVCYTFWLLFVCFALSQTVKAQQVFPIQHLLNSYLETRMKHDDATQSITRLNSMFKQMDKKQQQAFRDSIYSSFLCTKSDSKVEECEAFIELYKFFSIPNDTHMPALCFAQGEIAATVKGDTIALKESINDLLVCNEKKYPEVTSYLDRLNTYLKNIRDYIPMRRTLEGVWIAAGSRDLYEKWNLTHPSLILEFSQRGDSIRLLGTSHPMYSYYLDNALMPQDVIELSENRMYLSWSNERLKKVDAAAAGIASTLVGETVGTIRSSIMSNIGSSFGDQLLGNIGGGMLSLGTDLLLDAMFSPKKKISILEIELEKLNDYELLAHINFQRFSVSPDGTIGTPKVEKKTVSLFRNCFHTPNVFIPVQLGEKKTNEFNKQCIAAIVSASEQAMLKNGIPIPNTDIHQRYKDMAITLGINGKSHKNGGVQVSGLNKRTFAPYSGLKKGDIIFSIDDFDVNTLDDIEDYVKTLPSFSKVTLCIQRSKKGRMELQLPSSLVDKKK